MQWNCNCTRERERERARKRVRKRGKYVPYVTIRFEGPRRLLAGGGMRSLEVGWDGIGRTKQGQTIASKSTVDKRAKGKVTMSRDGGQARFTHRHTAGFSVGTRSSSQLRSPKMLNGISRPCDREDFVLQQEKRSFFCALPPSAPSSFPRGRESGGSSDLTFGGATHTQTERTALRLPR